MNLTTVLEMQGEPDHTENQEPALSMTYAASACGEWRRAGIWTSATFTIWQLWQSLEPPSLPVTNRHGRRRTGRMRLPRGCGPKPSIDQPALSVAAMYNSGSATPTKCLSFGGDERGGFGVLRPQTASSPPRCDCRIHAVNGVSWTAGARRLTRWSQIESAAVRSATSPVGRWRRCRSLPFCGVGHFGCARTPEQVRHQYG